MSQIFPHLDAAESVFFSRELEHIKAKAYDIKYPMLLSRQYIPVSNEVPSGAENVTYRQYDRVGEAKGIHPGATDLPRVDAKGKEFTRPVRWYGDSYGWNLIEIRQSQLTGRSLDSRKAEAARRAWEEIVDYVACFGDPDWGIAEGFINSSAVTIDAAGANWSSAAPDAMIANINTMYGNVATDTKGIERPDTLLVPDAQYQIITGTPRSTTSDTTVAEFLLKSNPWLTAIEPWYRLDAAGAAGVQRAVLYKRSPDFLQQEIPNEFEQLAVYQRGMNYEIGCIGATAGTTFYYPRSCRYMDGI